jgi:hypothetical protein
MQKRGTDPVEIADDIAAFKTAIKMSESKSL